MASGATTAPSAPSSVWARRTASQSRRSATTLASGDQIATISALAYRAARTFGMLTNTQLTVGPGLIARAQYPLRMYFAGVDLAWAGRNPTGVAVVDADGDLVHL